MTEGLENASDPKWTETVLAGVLPTRRACFRWKVDRDARVAARCWAARPPIPESFQDALLDELVDALGRETAEGREIARFLIVIRCAANKCCWVQREWRRRHRPARPAPVVEPADPRMRTWNSTCNPGQRDRFKAVVSLERLCGRTSRDRSKASSTFPALA
jgi:hypothetical protein